MAWLESKGGVFRIRFRYGGKKHLHALHTTCEREANETLARFETHSRLVDQGLIDPPPDGADLGTYLASGGKLAARPGQVVAPNRPTLRSLFESYTRDFPRDTKEANTWVTEMLHLRNLRKKLDLALPLTQVTAQTLQGYIDARCKEAGKGKRKLSRKTIQKEIGTLATIWNKWAIPQGFVSTRLPSAGLNYPKGIGRPPFQTREQVERQIAQQKLSREAQQELWQCLFLTLPEVEEVLAYVRENCPLPYVYPMFVFAAHTGARISEMRRSLRADIDFEAKTILVREKKKDTSKRETYRTVPLTPLLEAALRAWFPTHPGGPHTFCGVNGRAISIHYAMKVVKQALRQSKWRVISGWHCFRHSFISNAVARGLDQRLIDHWVGHTTEEMRRRYSHLVPKTSQEAIRALFGPTS